MSTPKTSLPSAASPALSRDLAPSVSHDGDHQARRSGAGDTDGASPDCPSPKHGTLTAYRNGCRCQQCKAENNTRASRNRRRKAMGITSPDDRVPFQPTYDAVMRLRALGYTDPQIGRLAGLPDARIGRIRSGGKYVTRETAERVQSALTLINRVPPRNLLAARYVDANGARLRIRALITQGWSQDELGRRLGHSTTYLSPVLYTDRRITPALHAAISDLYERLWREPGPSTSAARRAAARGWATPLELDDDLLDNPGYVPTLHRPDAASERRTRHEQRLERRTEVARLTAAGLSIRQISQQLDLNERQVVRDRVVLREAS